MHPIYWPELMAAIDVRIQFQQNRNACAGVSFPHGRFPTHVSALMVQRNVCDELEITTIVSE